MADEGQIKVQLSLLSAQDSQAAADLAKALNQTALMFQALKASDFRDTAEKLSQLHAKMVQDTDRFIQEGKAMQTRGQGEGGRSTPQEAARQGVDLNDFMEKQRQQREDQERQRKEAQEAEKETRDRLAAEQEKREQQRRDRDDTPQTRREANRPTLDAWMEQHGVRAEVTEGDGGADIRGGGFRIPRFGELNVQDVINRARDRNLRQMLDADTPEAMDAASRGATRAQNWSDRVGNAYAGRHFFREASNWARNQGVNPGDFPDVGAQLGYSRDSNPLSQIFGFQTPFSAAGAEGFRQARDTLRLRWQAGINGQQAQEITQATAGAGFGGDIGSDIRTDLMAPLVRRFGVNPQEITPFLQVLRTGTADIQDLQKVLGDMGEAARSANLTLSEYNQSLAASVESTQAMGGSAMRGAEFGRQFMVGTGLPSTVGNDLSNNPLIQGFIGAQTGVPGMAQGMLSATQRMQGIRSAVNMLEQNYSGAMGGLQRRATQEVRDPDTGQVVGTARPGNLAMGAAAHQLGISPDALSQFMRTENRQARVEAFNVRADTYEQTTSGAASNPRLMNQRREALITMAQDQNTGGTAFGGGRERYRYNAQGELEHSDASGNWKVIADREKLHDMADDWATKRAQGGTRQWNQLRDAAVRIGVDKDDLKDAEKIKDTRKRTERVRQLVSESSREAEAQYEIAMTPLTKRFFKVLAKDQNVSVDWNEPRNTPAASPPGPSPLSPRTNTGAGPVNTHGGP